MQNIISTGMTDRQISAFFKSSISTLSVAALEGNRAFAAVITATAGSKIMIYSEMADLVGGEEIGVIGMKEADREMDILIDLPEPYRRPLSLHKLVGEVEKGVECECGIILETVGGLTSISAGSFPNSINIVSALFDQGLMMNSFQPFKYYTRPIVVY